ncbi:MAG TPA: hypothetical protein VFF59_09410 [Anaerolineae bacterium]|nr:hypothetical protein [Anaerolineae bacterium]
MDIHSAVIRDWSLNIDVDMVLRGQGADPAVIRQRKPRLVAIAERAVADGARLIDPAVAYRTLSVEAVRHERLMLAGGAALTGARLAQHLSAAQSVTLIVCTLGDALEQRVSALMSDDPAYALALDGFGSVAAEALGVAMCGRLEAAAQRADWHTSVPLSPGMIGWPVDVGQLQIFSLLDTAPIGVTLNASAQMTPHKSTSMILGASSTPFSAGRACDFCARRETCRYQDHYQPV